jgi:hypothetical protein
MEESLLSFADKVVELSGREWIDGSKVQVRKEKKGNIIKTWDLYIYFFVRVATPFILGRTIN